MSLSAKQGGNLKSAQKFQRATVLTAAFLGIFLCLTAQGLAGDLVFGPETCQRGTGAPTVFSYSFPATEPTRGYVFKVYNGGLEDTTYEMVSSSTVTLNGVQILGPSNFSQNVSYLEVPITLQTENALEVEVRGKPGGAMIIKILPLVVIESPIEGQVLGSPQVAVAGHLYSAVASVSVNGVAATVTDLAYSASGVPLIEGANVITATATRADGFTGRDSVAVTLDTTPPAITLMAPSDGAVLADPTVEVTGSVDDPSATVTVNGSPVALTGGQFSAAISLTIGPNTIEVAAEDTLGNGSTVTIQVTYTPPPPTVSLSASPTAIALGGSTTLAWSALAADRIIVEPGIGEVGPAGSAEVSPSATMRYRITAIGEYGVASASVLVSVTGSVAPIPERHFGEQYQDLIPSDATIAEYDQKRFSLVTGQIADLSSNPIAGVLVKVHGRPELGTARSDETGRYSLPVEGGYSLTVEMRKEGFLTVHRKVAVGWNDTAAVDDVVMLAEDPAATSIVLDGNPASAFVHQGTPVVDEHGRRTASLVLPGDVQVYARTEAGDVPVTSFELKATEHVIPESMPAHLPPPSAFTYCADLAATGLENVRFSKPVAFLVDNFLGFDVGETVPVGYYDFDLAQWVPSENGRVVALLDTDGDGSTDAVDATGDSLADDLNNDGSFADEAFGLGDPTRFPPGSTFWRTMITHLTPWDCNWPFGLAQGAGGPNGGNPSIDSRKCPDSETETASHVLNRSCVYHDEVPIPGTDCSLTYNSDRASGYHTMIMVPASGASPVHPDLLEIKVEVNVAGRKLGTSLPPAPSQVAKIAWDGLDHLGRPVPAIVQRRYVSGLSTAPTTTARSQGGSIPSARPD